MRSRRRAAYRETSAGGVIYRWVEDVPHILLIRDAYSRWALPKGHVEAGETPEAAALREVREETGLAELNPGPLLQTIDWFFRSGRGLVHKYCHFYLVEAPTGEAAPQVEEGITECCWLPIDAAVDRISYANAREVLRLAARRLRQQRAGTG